MEEFSKDDKPLSERFQRFFACIREFFVKCLEP